MYSGTGSGIDEDGGGKYFEKKSNKIKLNMWLRSENGRTGNQSGAGLIQRVRETSTCVD